MSNAAERHPRLVLTGGEGAPALLVHGFGSDRLSWLANQSALQAARTVYTLNLPGHGGEDLAERDLGEIAAGVAASIAAAADGPWDLIGHSLGGLVCIMVAASRPDLVRSLALIAPAGLGRGVDREFLAGFPRVETAPDARELLTRLFERPRFVNDQLVAHVLAQLAPSGRREALGRVAAMVASPGEGAERAIGAVAASALPRLVVWGAKDRINACDSAGLEAFGGASVILPESGHLPHVESAAEVNRALLAFLSAGTSVSSGD